MQPEERYEIELEESRAKKAALEMSLQKKKEVKTITKIEDSYSATQIKLLSFSL